jgi:hypothetical protein
MHRIENETIRAGGYTDRQQGDLVRHLKKKLEGGEQTEGRQTDRHIA